MKTIIGFIFLCSLCVFCRAGELCSPNVTMYDLPEGVLPNLISMATTGLVIGFTGCSGNFQVDQNKIGFWLYNKANHDTPVLLDPDNPTQINPNEKVIFIIHGWTCNITGEGFPEMKDAFLQKYPEANVILVEWTTYSVDLYVNAYCHIPNIAALFGKFICNLNAKYNIDVSQLHLVGHSMGGQIAGLTGQETKKQCNKVLGRITGLDPAGPVYATLGPDKRLDPTDAILVDVIHTNQGELGYYGICGTVDFFPNCGYIQPGCLEITPSIDIAAILNVPFTVFLCNHQRSIFLFNESILSDGLVGKSCKVCPGLPQIGPCIADLFGSSTSVMGENYPKYASTDSRYFLRTNKQPPYAVG